MKLIIIAAIIFLVIVVSGCTNQQIGNGVADDKISLPDYDECKKIGDYRRQDACFSMISIEFAKLSSEINDPDICLTYNSTEGKHWCYKQYAYHKKISGICNLIIDNETKGECIKNVAVNTLDIDLCFELDGVIAGRCMADVINGIGDKDFIELIENEPDFCSRFIGYNYTKNECHFKTAILFKDLSECENIINRILEDNINDCRDMVYYRMVKESNDTSICDNIISNYKRDMCLNPLE